MNKDKQELNEADSQSLFFGAVMDGKYEAVQLCLKKNINSYTIKAALDVFSNRIRADIKTLLEDTLRSRVSNQTTPATLTTSSTTFPRRTDVKSMMASDSPLNSQQNNEVSARFEKTIDEKLSLLKEQREFYYDRRPFNDNNIAAQFKKNALIALNKRLITPDDLHRMHHDHVLRLLTREPIFNAFQSREIALRDFLAIPVERLSQFDKTSIRENFLKCFESEKTRSQKGIPNQYTSSDCLTQFGRDLENSEYSAVKLLLDKKEPIDPEYDPMGFKRIHLATMHGQCETIKLLLDLKPSDVDLRSPNGRPLRVAKWVQDPQKRLDVLQILLERGARVDQSDIALYHEGSAHDLLQEAYHQQQAKTLR